MEELPPITYFVLITEFTLWVVRREGGSTNTCNEWPKESAEDGTIRRAR